MLYKEHIEIDAVTSGIGTFSSQLMTVFGANTYLETFDTTSTYTPVRGSMIESSYANTVLVAMSSNGGGNSLIFSWQLPSNIYAGNYIETISSQKANNFERYTDEDGELGSFTLHMFDNLSTGDTTETQFLATADAYPNTSTSYINNDLITNDSSFILSKDRREIIGGTIHFQQKSKDINKIGLGRALSSRNRITSENPPTTIKLYTYTNGYKFSRSNVSTVTSGYNSNNTAVISTNILNFNFTIDNSELTSSVDSYCLADENDNILIWVNQDGTTLDTITFDFLNKASDIKYKY